MVNRLKHHLTGSILLLVLAEFIGLTCLEYQELLDNLACRCIHPSWWQMQIGTNLYAWTVLWHVNVAQACIWWLYPSLSIKSNIVALILSWVDAESHKLWLSRCVLDFHVPPCPYMQLVLIVCSCSHFFPLVILRTSDDNRDRDKKIIAPYMRKPQIGFRDLVFLSHFSYCSFCLSRKGITRRKINK